MTSEPKDWKSYVPCSAAAGQAAQILLPQRTSPSPRANSVLRQRTSNPRFAQETPCAQPYRENMPKPCVHEVLHIISDCPRGRGNGAFSYFLCFCIANTGKNSAPPSYARFPLISKGSVGQIAGDARGGISNFYAKFSRFVMNIKNLPLFS